MSALAELISGVLQDVLIIRFARDRGKRFVVAFGAVMVLCSVILLWFLYSEDIATPADLYRSEINYSHATSNTSDGIALRTNGGDYIIRGYLLPKHVTRESIVEAMNKSGDAIIWTETRESRDVWGIETAGFAIDPTVGTNWKRENNSTGLIVGWSFLGMGVILCLIAFFSDPPLLAQNSHRI